MGKTGRSLGSKPKGFVLRKDGNVYAFMYPAGLEKAALRALVETQGLDRTDVLALVCYMGHNPRDFGLDGL